MQQSVSNRKRPAPGASPTPQQQQQQQQQQQITPHQPVYQYPQMPDNPDLANFDFNGYPTDQTYADPSLKDPNDFAASLNASQPPTYGSNIAPLSSTDLVRRPQNQQLAPQQKQWNDPFDVMNGQGEEDEEELQRKVAAAKKDVQGKRKQIPPFVQKLGSFLDVNYSHLIRWSDDGRSFIVLDEDEFARTLIPELFKHNNYASFVRQLNMYGFHKTVNITDGSLRQSEKARKGVKPPSMYSHPYFRQGRPDLLWLIQKPTGKAPSKKKREPGVKGEGFDSDDERQFSPGPEGRTHGELGNIGGNQDLTSMPRGELNAVKHEIKKLQQQQGIISRMIQQLKEQNDHFYRQATAFQALHDRHENSINAILTFLATFYSRSLEGHQGQNLANLFGSAATQNNQQQPQGGVVEEYNDSTQEADNQVQRYAKRPQLLLTGPNASSSPFQEAGNAMTAPNSARASVSPAEDGPSFPHKRDSSTSAPPVRPNSGAVAMAAQSPVVKDDAQTPDLLNSVPENDQMLSLINNMNATTTPSNDSTPAYEYSDALNNIQKANGIGSLTKQQTNDVMAILASQGAAGASANNALTRLDPNENLDMSKLRETQQSIERLSQLSSDNSTRLTDLQARLGPFSPSGSVPGMSYGGGEPNYGDPGQYDPNNFVKFDEYNDDDINYFNHDGFDWGFDPNAQIVEQGSGADVFSGGDDGIPVDRLAPQPTGHGIIESDAPNPAQEADTGNGDGAKVESSPSNKRRRIS